MPSIRKKLSRMITDVTIDPMFDTNCVTGNVKTAYDILEQFSQIPQSICAYCVHHLCKIPLYDTVLKER